MRCVHTSVIDGISQVGVPVDRQPLLFASPGRTAEPRQPLSPRTGPTRRRVRGCRDSRRTTTCATRRVERAARRVTVFELAGVRALGADDRTSYGTPFDG